MANPRVKDRQKTCGDPHCRTEWHRRKCAEWNKNNSDYFKSNYLQRKLEAATPSEKTPKPLLPKSRLKSGLPLEVVQEVISLQHMIILEYFGQLLFRRFQEVIKGQVVVNTGKAGRLPPLGFSRGDRL
jgi:hypothetical protein